MFFLKILKKRIRVQLFCSMVADNTGNVLLGTNFTSNPLETWELNWLNRTRLSINLCTMCVVYVYAFVCM